MKTKPSTPIGAGTICLILITLCGIGQVARGQTQYDLNVQSQRDFEKADAELNVVYRRTLNTCDPATAKELKAAERAWIVFRDAEATYEASSSEGGSIYTLEYNTARTTLTHARIAQLKAST